MDTNKKLLAIATKLAGLASGLDNCNSSAEQQAADLANDAKKLLAATPSAQAGVCYGCEGIPAFGNNPCQVCGMRYEDTAPQPQGDASPQADKALADRLLTMADSDMVPMENAMNLLREAAAALSPQADKTRGKVVGWEWRYIGNDPYPKVTTVARSLHEMDPNNPPYPNTWQPVRPLYTAPQPQAGEVEPFGHYFRDVEGMDRFHRGPRAPGFAQSDITPLYTTLPQPQGDASGQVSGGGEVLRALMALRYEAVMTKERAVLVSVDSFDQIIAALSSPQARPSTAELLGGPNCRRIGDYLVNIEGTSIAVSKGKRLVIAHEDTPQARPGGDFYDILYGAKITLILNAGDDASGEVPLTVGATVGTESDLTILCHAEEDGKPITLSVDPQADVARLVGAARDARFALYGNGPGNPALDAALKPFIAAQQVES